ncbi:MAG: ABC transporter [Alteromonadaceae bacterium]|nr:ABC transporter [Alteromonadaceae bacterium]
MKKKWLSVLSLGLLAVLFVLLVFINNQLLSKYRIDLTEDKVFSLSEGTRNVLTSLDEPVTLYFFYSDSATTGMTKMRNYAARVESLLREYAQASGGKVQLQIVDPVPFSENEDKASQFGLTGAALGNAGEQIYFGLAGTNLLDDQFTIPFFDPKNEQFLEYEISKLIYRLSNPDTLTLALVTDLPVAGGQDPLTGRYTGPMVFYQQLAQLYNIRIVNSTADGLPEDTDVVLLAHPQALSDGLLYAIDQFAMHNGRILAFIDPHYEGNALSSLQQVGANASSFPLLKAWGIKADLTNIVLDAQLAFDLRNENGAIVKHFGILGLTAAQLDRNDVITANLDSVNGASFGALETVKKAGMSMHTLIRSSVNSGLTNADNYAQTLNPVALHRGFGGNTETYTVAARYRGKARSYFSAPKDPAKAATYEGQTDNLNLVLVADADMLSDRYWVQQTAFFGDTVFTPFANNGDFIVNAIENLTGSDALISIRSRGTYVRPFERVKALETAAEGKYREQEEQLQEELIQTEQKLRELQGQQGQGGTIVFTGQQQEAIDKYIARRVEIRRELREVRYQLDREIDRLGDKLKIVNIALAPAVLTGLLWLLAFIFKRRAGKAYRTETQS